MSEQHVGIFITGVCRATWIFLLWNMTLQFVEPYRCTD